MFVPIKYGWPKGGADVQFNPALLAMVRIMKYGNDPDAHALGIAAGNAARLRILDGMREAEYARDAAADADNDFSSSYAALSQGE